MLPQQHRLRRRADIQRLRREGKAWRHPLAVLLVLPTSQEGDLNGRLPIRFGFTASRAAGSAVQRNRAKRLLREAVRPHLPVLDPGWDCLVIARQETAGASFEAVSAAVHSLLQRACLLPATTAKLAAQEAP
jgi:ribonuclease P protein component